MRNSTIEIIYEDEHLIVVEKPAGMLSVKTSGGNRGAAHRRGNQNARGARGMGHMEEITAHSILNDYIRNNPQRGRGRNCRDARVFIVHRLDRETSGLMVFAKSEEVKHLLQENWEQAVTKRGYVAVVNDTQREQSHSRVQWETNKEGTEGIIRSWLKENRTFIVYSSPKENGGQFAQTQYKIIGNNPKAGKSLLELELHTGRKNQIRVHLQEIGSPIYGDKKYFGNDTNILAENKKARRLYLHAYALNFIHPVTGRQMKFSTGIPREFRNIISCSQQPY